MAFKFVALLGLLAVANAGLLPATQVYHAAPGAQVYHHAVPEAQVYHHAVADAQVYHHDAPAAQVYHHAAGQVYHNAAPVAAVVKTVAPVTHYSAQPVLANNHDEFDSHPQYKYAYNVQDAVSGDSKSQVEERDGDAVRGEYSLIDADGYRRTVKYTADDHSGFNAVVEREPLSKAVVAPAVANSYAPIAHYASPALVKTAAHQSHYATPTAVKTIAPVIHHTAPAYTTYSSPIPYVAHH